MRCFVQITFTYDPWHLNGQVERHPLFVLHPLLLFHNFVWVARCKDGRLIDPLERL